MRGRVIIINQPRDEYELLTTSFVRNGSSAFPRRRRRNEEVDEMGEQHAVDDREGEGGSGAILSLRT